MNTTQARALITDTFPQPFDKGRFHYFVKELLNGFNEDKSRKMAVPEAFAAHVRSCVRLGTYESPDRELADVLIVNTTEPWKLERTRTALRDFVAHKLKRGDSYKEAGLVAFVAPDARSWRFSFVRMEYESKRDPKTGKVAVEERLTPARRFSYIVGENESCHTAQNRFLDLLQDTENKPTLAQIEKAFSVETVTKEFFEQYKALFLDLKEELDDLAKNNKTIGAEFAAKNVSTTDFAKKLMGQIVFLYFLQKKGWLGVPKRGNWGDGPHNFLRQLFDGRFRPHKNFFNDILEALFYDTLATDRGHEAWCNHFNCRIPFLNGGLFEALRDYDWKETDIIIPNSLFSNTKTTKAGDTGTGILDVFDRYNFTVNEAEPLEKEVAIDPEMLGKVFENLLDVKERKSKGSFYTPREIVHYMCQESLINYLDTQCGTGIPACDFKTKLNAGIPACGPAKNTDRNVCVTLIPRGDIETFVHLGDQISHYEAVETRYAVKMPKSIEHNARLIDERLADIAVCDPAVGSGAFLVGMMHEIVRARSALTPYLKGDTDIPVCDLESRTAIPVHGLGENEEETRKTRRNLPHWTKDGSIYWITFRLADSLPQEKLEAWKAERDIWKSHHPEPWSEADWREYDERFGERLEGWLDAGHGSCALARPEIRRTVQDCLLRFDGEKLRLHAGVIMPNHVHLLLEPLAGNSLSELLKGIKGTSSHKVKQTFLSASEEEKRQTGMSASPWKFWMDESYDHIVRSQAQYQHFLRYIADNPVKANLCPGKFWLYEGGTDIPVCVSGEEKAGETQTGMSVPRSAYYFKRHAIQNCLYGVDIDPGAVEIAKLRLWLSLVVDEDDVKQIKPLPNLDYKVVTGNSLLGVEKDLLNANLFERLEELKPRYFDATDRKQKEKLKHEIDDLIHQLCGTDIPVCASGDKKNTDRNVCATQAFDFEIHFSEIFHHKKGFDIVIANPPYVRQESIKELKPALKAQGYECFDGVADLLVYFYERGVKLLRGGGTIALITSNKYYRAGYGEKLRGFLARELTLHRLIDFGDAPVFEAIAYASILTGVRAAPAKDASALAYTWEKEMAFDRIAQIVPERGQQIRQSELKPDGWRLESPAVLRLLEKLRRAGKPLGEYVNGRFYRGILTGLNEAFVVDRTTRDRLIREHKSSAEILKPFLRGRDVKRWCVGFAEQYLIKIESSENKEHPWSGKSEKEAQKILEKTYPAIYEHFQSLRDIKLERPDARGCRNKLEQLQSRDDQGKYFWELRSCAYWKEFDQPKVVYPDIAPRCAFALDGDGLYPDCTLFLIPEATKWLLAVLNSQVISFFFPKICPQIRGDFMRFKSIYMEQIPIPAVTSEQQEPVERLVERILSAKGGTGIPACDLGKSTDRNVCVTLITQLEREIDELVYALYGLTAEEINVVEREA